MSNVKPLYTTSGEVAAVYHQGNIYNHQGEWIGWVERSTGDVYSTLGYYVGHLAHDHRILRHRGEETLGVRRPVPHPPTPPDIPASFPLPAMMAELDYSTVDVLEEEPEKLHPPDAGDMREDLS